MKALTGFFTLLVCIFLLSACSPESTVNPAAKDSPDTQESFGTGPARPATICGSSFTRNLENNTNDILGEVEVINDNQHLYFVVGLYHDWVVNKLDLFIGKRNNLPIHAGSANVNAEAFGHNYNFGRPVNNRNFRIPIASLSSLGSCFDIAIKAEISQMDLFGSTYNNTDVWLVGDRVADGFVTAHCVQSCSIIPSGSGNSSN